MEQFDNAFAIKYLFNYLMARIDIKNFGTAKNSIKILHNSDNKSEISYEPWFKDEHGEGIIIHSVKTELNLKIKCINDGELNIILRSKDLLDKNKNRFPIYIDYTNFKVNDIPIINNHTVISHDKPHYFKKKVKNSEIIDIHCEWLPFNSYCEFANSDVININNNLKSLKNEFNNFKEETNKCLDSNNFLFNTIFLDYKHEPNHLMNDLKVSCIELLSFIGNICKKYNLSWWLDYGNLLGAIRHEDFVPWDDDIDIGMMRQDYNKFLGIISNEIKKYGLENIITVDYRWKLINGKRVGSIIQVLILHETEGGRRLPLAGVDVFPYDYLKGYEDCNSLNKLFHNTKLNFYKNQSNDITYTESLKQYYDELNCTFKKTKMIIPGVEGSCGPYNQYSLMVLDADKVFPLKLRKYSYKMFPCPHDPDYYLKSVYGDYMNIPKVVYHHTRVKDLRYTKNYHEDFTKYINILKKVNATFIK